MSRNSRLTTHAYNVGYQGVPGVSAAFMAAGTPTGCVRAPSSQYFVTKEACETVKPAGRTCVPRFDNVSGIVSTHTHKTRHSAMAHCHPC